MSESAAASVPAADTLATDPQSLPEQQHNVDDSAVLAASATSDTTSEAMEDGYEPDISRQNSMAVSEDVPAPPLSQFFSGTYFPSAVEPVIRRTTSDSVAIPPRSSDFEKASSTVATINEEGVHAVKDEKGGADAGGAVDAVAKGDETAEFESKMPPTTTTNNNGFYNHGLALWERTRAEWLKNHHGEERQRTEAKPLDVDDIIDVIFASSRQQQQHGRQPQPPLLFPQPVPLPQMVDILQDLWEAEGLDT